MPRPVFFVKTAEKVQTETATLLEIIAFLSVRWLKYTDQEGHLERKL